MTDPRASDAAPELPQLTRGDLLTMTSDEIAAAKTAGQLDDLLGIERPTNPNP